MRWFTTAVAQAAMVGTIWLGALSPSVARAQTVQLPSFGGFSVRTSVLVPDRGRAYLGGVRRSSYASGRLGVPGIGSMPLSGRLGGSRVASGGSSAGGASVHVTVIDHAALDQAVLAEAARRRGGAEYHRSGRQTVGDRSRGSQAKAAPPLQSVAEIRRQNAERKSAEVQQANEFAAQGHQAARDGHRGAAKIYYQMAYRRGDAKLRQQMLAELAKLE